MELHVPTSQAWVDAVIADFNPFLLDHAANERKASAAALTFVVRYPDKLELMEPMIQLAREELTHFHRVYRIMAARGLRFERDTKDLYLSELRQAVGQVAHHDLLNRLLLAGVVEARGCERFGLVGQALTDPELKTFYEELAYSEARHADLFVELASNYFDEQTIQTRLNEILVAEARVIEALPIRSALH